MANNPYVNKVEYAGNTLIDLTGDDVTAGDVLSGVKFHLPSGAQGTGSLALATSIAGATVTLASNSFVYDGTEKTQAVSSVVLNGVTLTEGTDYVIVGNTATNAGSHTLYVLGQNNYTGMVSASWSISKAQGTISVNPASISIEGISNTVTSVITKTGDGTVSASTSNSSVATASVSGDTVTVTSVGAGSATITVTMADGNNYLGASATISATVLVVNVFGVVWNYANSSTALTRLTPSTDPNGWVNTTISSEPSPAVGTGDGSSPFDNYMPWSGMDEYNIINGAVSYRKGDSGFSRSSYDTMVYIPSFYCKIIKDATNAKMYFYVADIPVEGFYLHPGSNSYVGRYHTANSSGYVSKTGLAAVASITRATARTNSHSKGDHWWQWGVAQWMAVQLLYLVEFADWNSQAKIGNGRVYSNGTGQNSGGTDSMVYHTGRASGTENQQPVQYRHIENIWGNFRNWLDGLNFNNRAAYACTDPSLFADDTTTNYTAAGLTLPSSNYITGMGVSSALPWLMLPTAASSGSVTTYVADYVYSSTGWCVAFVAGLYSASTTGFYGMFYLNGSNTSSSTAANIGSRLMFIP